MDAFLPGDTFTPMKRPQNHILALATTLSLLVFGTTAHASQAYGSINNFDTVNDTGTNCHGFEIELDDCHSTDITYTYDYNHYGTPLITEDTTSAPGHTNVIVRYQGIFTNGAWSAYTAVPTNVIAPTMGHQFTDPSVNFGGEHFGVGFYKPLTSIKYHWLQDDGSGHLVLGPAVSIATPSYNYIPAVVGVPAQIQPVIVPPPAPVPPPVVLEFGHATWVKEITTTGHTNTGIQLRDLVSNDTNYPTMKNWANSEPTQVESEWSILQTDSGQTNGGANGVLQGNPVPVNQGDDVVTMRYEFYQYLGPLDPQTGEALADTVAADGIHGTLTYSNTVVVGKFLGAQMSSANPSAPVGVIDHLQDGQVGTQYPSRTAVVAGGAPFIANLTNGTLPSGMSFNAVTGIISGTPTIAGTFPFTINATDNVHPSVSQKYILRVAAAGAALPPHSVVAASVTPANSGTITGEGDLPDGQNDTLVAIPKAGYSFVNWSEAGVPVSTATNYTFNVKANHTLVATFKSLPAPAAQKISFTPIPSHKVTDGKVTLSATASSGLPVTYTLVSPNHASLAGNVLTLKAAGIVQVNVTQGGNASWQAAPPVSISFLVTTTPQTITFPVIPTHKLSDLKVTLAATASSGLPVTYILGSPNHASIAGNILTLKAIGLVQIVASQSGNSAYAPATPMTNIFSVTK